MNTFQTKLWHCWIGCCALALVAQTQLLFGIRPGLTALEGFAFFGAVCGYSLSRHLALPRWFTALAVFAAVACFAYLPFPQQVASLVPAGVWALYNGLWGRHSLRTIPALKPVAVAIAWSWFTVILPLPPELWQAAIVPAIGRAAFVFALAIATDLCDLEYDAQVGLKTLVAQWGPRYTLRVFYAALAVSAACVWINWALQRYRDAHMIALELSLVLAAVGITLVLRTVRGPHAQKVLIDAATIMQFALVWTAIPIVSASNG